MYSVCTSLFSFLALPKTCDLSPLAKKVSALFFACLLTASGASIPRRLKGGSLISCHDLTSLAPPERQYGPSLTSEMQCLIVKNTSAECHFLAETICTKNALAGYADLLLEPAGIAEYIEQAKGLTPFSNAPIKQFPDCWEATWLSEFFLVDNGSCGCELAKADECEVLCEQAREVIDENKLEKLAYSEQAFRGKGYLLGLGETRDTMVKVRVGINPKRTQNFKRMCEKLSEEMVQDPCFFNKSIAELLRFIKDLHRVLYEDIPAENIDELHSVGDFRKWEVLVFHDESTPRSYDALREKLLTLGATEKELALFKSSAKNLKHLVDRGSIQRGLSFEEKAVWEKLVYFPPMPEEIIEQMRFFVFTLKRLAKKDVHPIALAAWVHCTLVRIHPFSDGNGNVARAFMNAILLRGGFPAHHIRSESAYIEAISRDSKTRGAFADYLFKEFTSQPHL